MYTIETHDQIPLSSIKPLDRLLSYRADCLRLTEEALRRPGSYRRTHSPVSAGALFPFGEVEGLPYGRCPASGSLFVTRLPEKREWGKLLGEVARLRRSPGAFHAVLTESRAIHVYAPKLEWIKQALRLYGIRSPRLLEVAISLSDLAPLLRESGSFAEVVTLEESTWWETAAPSRPSFQAAILLESLDRADDPEGLLHRALEDLEKGGLVFVTALVASGFDMTVLGTRNLYLYPPDRANCFSLRGLTQLLEKSGLALLEVSTPGVLDIEVVAAHRARDPQFPLSSFEKEVLEGGTGTHAAFQAFLQQAGLSSFARLVAQKR